MSRDPKQDPYYNPDFSDEINEVTNAFVYEKKVGKQFTGDAIIVRPKGDTFEVLLIERKRGPHQGGLALPGGFKEGADKVEDFVAREALEETGLTNKDIKKTIDLPTKTDRFDWDVRFADGVDVSGKIFIVDDSFTPIAGDDAVSAKFVSIDNIASGKVDVAFLHSEWIYDTAVELNSSLAPELQKIVDKDRTRNINFMQEINKKRAIDNQPLMNVDATPEISGSLDNISKQIMANEAGIKTFDQLINEFEGEFLKGLSPEDAESFANWYLDSGFDKEGKARAWLNENTDRLSDPRMVDDDTSFAMEQQGFDEVAETNKAFEQELIDIEEEKFQNFRNAREDLEEGLITYEEYVNRTDDDFLNKIPDDIVIDTPNAPLKGNQLKQILKNRLKKLAIGGLNYLDMYELGLIGYALAEPAAQKLLEPIMPFIVPGYKAPENNESYKDQVIANLQETAKISPTAKLVEKMPEKVEYEKLDNLGYGWLGKMLDR